MPIDTWIRDLPRRLELAADVLDDLANGDSVTSDEDRDRLFVVEAQIWRIAQSTRRASGPQAALLPFLDRSLRAVRSNLALCVKLGVCEDDEAAGLLEGLVRDLDRATSELAHLRRAEEACQADAAPADQTASLRAAGGQP